MSKYNKINIHFHIIAKYNEISHKQLLSEICQISNTCIASTVILNTTSISPNFKSIIDLIQLLVTATALPDWINLSSSFNNIINPSCSFLEIC